MKLGNLKDIFVKIMQAEDVYNCPKCRTEMTESDGLLVCKKCGYSVKKEDWEDDTDDDYIDLDLDNDD